jgi:23S rRNA pseudouridine1911/1915/1917 synthase
MRGGKPRIPPGAPGHPLSEARPRKGRGVLPEPGPGRRRSSPKGRPERETEGSGLEAAEPERRRAFVPLVQGKAVLAYEDEELLAYDKPSGLSVIAGDGSRSRCLLDIATEQVRRHNPKGRAAVVHRIDRDTSGIVLFAKSAKVKAELMGDWDELVAERLYVALVEGSMGSGSGVYDSWLKEDDKGRVSRAKNGEKGAKRAVTRWSLLAEGSGLSLLELSLETGRRHQIRVQLADAGHAIVGDPRYGPRPKPGSGGREPDIGRLCLHATAIELKRPGHKPLRIESPAPREFERALGRGASRAEAAGPASAPRASASSSLKQERSGARPRPPLPRAKGKREKP